ncbi:MAG: heme biosynthesis protein HemY [Alphaproteobacteria bacterium]|nr:heme biosynthesis protein HemY [Alphaproteobacteria bacterium]
MARLLGFIALAALVVAGAVWIADRPGTIAIVWQGWRVDTSVAMLLLLVGALALALAAALRVLGWAVRVPRGWRRWAQERRRRRGYQALTFGMVAVAAGDPEEAARQARRADVLLDEPPLTMLLSAQAAQLNGDEAAARRYFTAMLDRPETEFLGLRGLLMQASRTGDAAAALDLARRARRLRPETPWVLTTLFDLEARAGEWRAAEDTLAEAQRRRALPAVAARHRRAALLVERARAAEADGRPADALDLAARAHDEDPAFVPAVVLYVRLLGAGDRLRKAERTAERAWRSAPHPELAAAYRELAASADPVAQAQRMQHLVAGLPDHPESRLAVAAAAIAAALWGEARTQLEAAIALRPSTRAYALLAEVEEKERGDGAAAQRWLRLAAEAPAGEAWTCTSCGSVAATWSAVCPSCRAVDTLAWQAPAAIPLLPARAAAG